jgi:hypothetical protein
LLVKWDISQCTSVAHFEELEHCVKVSSLDGPRSCSGYCGEGEKLLSYWELSHYSLDVWPIFYLVFIGMFQVPADQKETDLVGRPIVHKSAYKQATGNFQSALKE